MGGESTGMTNSGPGMLLRDWAVLSGAPDEDCGKIRNRNGDSKPLASGCGGGVGSGAGNVDGGLT